MNKTRIGYALTGSFCTFSQTMEQLRQLAAQEWDIFPIMSFNAYNTDTRFGKAADFIEEMEQLSGKTVIHTIDQAEPIGPQKLLDVLVVAPCTGNTGGKIPPAQWAPCGFSGFHQRRPQQFRQKHWRFNEQPQHLFCTYGSGQL